VEPVEAAGARRVLDRPEPESSAGQLNGGDDSMLPRGEIGHRDPSRDESSMHDMD
jgi:hypothetical protein